MELLRWNKKVIMAHLYIIRFVRCRPRFESWRELEQESTTQIDHFFDFRLSLIFGALFVGYENGHGDDIADGRGHAKKDSCRV